MVPFDLGDSVLPSDQLHCYVWWKRYIRTRLRHEWWMYSSMGFSGFAKFWLSSLCLTNSMHCFQVDVWSCKTASKCIKIKELGLAWRARKFFFFFERVWSILIFFFFNKFVYILTVLPKPKIPIGFWLAYPLNIKIVSSLIGDNRHDIVWHDSAMRTWMKYR